MGRPVFLVTDARFGQHQAPSGHPESAERLQFVEQGIESAVSKGLDTVPLDIRPATTAELRRAHTEEHIERVRMASRISANLDPDTYTSEKSEEIARLAAGACIGLAEAVLGHSVANRGFAAVRPPGHHASSHRAMGFCLYCNAAIAALHVIESGLARRVAIIDWDVHHGNGTEEILKRDDRVLYASLHQFPYYPGTGHVSYVGEGDGRGWTVNLSMPSGCGGIEYLALFDRVLMPVLVECDPDLLIVSTGFDAHRLDPLAMMRLDSATFGTMTRRLLQLDRPIAIVLEGGYHPTALREGTEEMLLALSGSGRERDEAMGAPDQVAELIEQRAREALKPYWHCLRG